MAKTQPFFSLGQPIDLAARFALRELPAKCRPQAQLSLGDHAIPLPREDIHPDTLAGWILDPNQWRKVIPPRAKIS
ncbi:hypothetical protein V1283_000391 [Bradyrhizobium sp. AZCC 2262]|uniref:hypothetical protein n=1 Tax=Bradyrhizobium sp. AZCC 2262 TaxID=3117022 RepID=UPI002FEF1A7F